jgi:DMSO/TMAO reductase YedYZ molybdopterin-dependent catalytic subunit
MKMTPLSRYEEQGKMEQEGRLPPGQSLTHKFPVLHYGPVPVFDPNNWDFRCFGEVEKPLRLGWDEFSLLPRTRQVMDIHCVTTWSKFDTAWEGVRVRDLVDSGMLKILPPARFVIQHAEHGFTTNLPLDVVLQDNFLLATHFDGQPITPEHGAPLRGVVGAIPSRLDMKTPYFWKGAKWLRGLEFKKDDRPGFWEQAGYHNDADIWKEERYR